MCFVDRKTYRHPDGRREVTETYHRCSQAVQRGRMCSNVTDRQSEEARLVEYRPADQASADDNMIVTRGPSGHQTVWQDVSRRSGNRVSRRRTISISVERTRGEPSSPSSPFESEDTYRMPRAPSPPPLTGILRPSTHGTADARGGRAVRPDGIEAHPFREQARGDERRRLRDSGSFPSQRSSMSSSTAVLGGTGGDEQMRWRPRLDVDTPGPSPTSASPTTSSPGLSNLPPLSTRRHDSADPRHNMHRRNESEDERQARLERDRLANTDRREQRRREASRERHRAEAIEALEGRREESESRRRWEAEHRANLEAELAQTDRERQATAARRLDEARARQGGQERLRREVQARRASDEARHGAGGARGSLNEDRTTAPTSPRSRTYRVVLHQDDLPPPRESTMRQRGEEVIAQEQERARQESLEGGRAGYPRRAQDATARLHGALDVDFEDDEWILDPGDANNDAGLAERARRRAARDAGRAERAERRRAFWR